jgi:hypothetical protein
MNGENLDRLLSKYILVWLWSILFGASSGLTYTLIEYRPERWGQLALPLLLLSFLGILSAFASLISLIHYLLRYLIPSLFHADPVPEELALKAAGVYLKRASWFLVFAALARAGMALCEIAFSFLLRS